MHDHRDLPGSYRYPHPPTHRTISYLGTIGSTTMQRRDEHDLVAALELVRALAFQFPICIVNEDEDTWTTVYVLDVAWANEQTSGRVGERDKKRGDVHGIPLHEQLWTFREEMRA